MTVDLKNNPFFLTDEQIHRIQKILHSMTLEEKIGQLFIHMHGGHDLGEVQRMREDFHISGIRWRGGPLEKVCEQNKKYQAAGAIPLLVAANLEAGGNEVAQGGTSMANGAACAASPTLETTRRMAEVCAREAKVVGTNWVFGPICDILMNFRNTIVNTRSYGSNVDKVIDCSLAFLETMKAHGLACAAKHFPGDGVEERDQHLVMGCNDLSVEEWDQSFGRVYRALIDAGVQSIMTGHICLPAYTRKLRPEIRDQEIMPASLAPELLQGLLREQLGFNGVIITDASHMGGFCAAVSRKEGLPGAIASGCDMILFFNDPEEDIQYMKDGLACGLLTMERLEEAVLRVLALKASLGLFDVEPEVGCATATSVAESEEGYVTATSVAELVGGCAATPVQELNEAEKFGSAEHLAMALECARESITLVKDTQALLPICPSKTPHCLLYYIESAPMGRFTPTDPAKQMLIEELEAAGFHVTAPKDFYELEQEHSTPANIAAMMQKGSMEAFKQNYDFVLLAINMQGYAQTNNVRLSFSVGHSVEIPWYVHELPTVGVSFQYTNHLYDVPMLKTFINAYMPTREYIHAFVEKLIGASDFQGRADDTVWCERWDTRL